MNKNTLQAGLEKRLEQSIAGVTPGVVVSAIYRGKKAVNLKVGQTFPYYDLASLTKVISTVSLCMRLYQSKKFDLNDSLKKTVKWFTHETAVKELLTHTAGFPWWLPFYRKFDLNTQNFEMDSSGGTYSRDPRLTLAERSFWLEQELRLLAPQTPEQAVYSDVDFLLLKPWIERLLNKPVSYAFTELAESLGMESTFYHLNNSPVFSRESYAPTENCPWRGRVLQGEVHDENAWALGGVSTHAGLFGSMSDLELWALEIRKALRGESKIWEQKIVKTFTQRSVPTKLGDWALGFMMPSPGKASCGQFFSGQSFGHTGFTGTSVWFDPKQDLIVLILSNRVHPTRTNEAFRQLRPQIHDWICEALI